MAHASIELGESPEGHPLSKETLTYIQQTIDTLPLSQREVITLKDFEGCTSGEVCDILRISTATQRVLLHRARSIVRQALEGTSGAGIKAASASMQSLTRENGNKQARA
jgi:RNA polymerase sigma factor (sigma-70 family)